VATNTSAQEVPQTWGQAQPVLAAPVAVYNQPTPSPRKRLVQETLTQKEWGARPIPAGWTEHVNAHGSEFFYNRKKEQWAGTYEQMFIDPPAEPPFEIAIRKIPPNSQASLTESYRSTKKPRATESFRKPQQKIREVATQDLPGSYCFVPAFDSHEADDDGEENNSDDDKEESAIQTQDEASGEDEDDEETVF
jgi:hypothetical protein